MEVLKISSIFILLIISRIDGSPANQQKRDPSVYESGELSRISEHPWLAIILINNVHACTGSIITKNVILTSAHCLLDDSPKAVRVGSSKLHAGRSTHTIVHTRDNHELALVKVTPPMAFNENVTSIELFQRGFGMSLNIDANITGWQYSDELRFAKLRIADCGEKRSQDHICAAPTKDVKICQGESGGPLVINRVLVGVALPSSLCVAPESPGVYVNVYESYDWIIRNLEFLTLRVPAK